LVSSGKISETKEKFLKGNVEKFEEKTMHQNVRIMFIYYVLIIIYYSVDLLVIILI